MQANGKPEKSNFSYVNYIGSDCQGVVYLLKQKFLSPEEAEKCLQAEVANELSGFQPPRPPTNHDALDESYSRLYKLLVDCCAKKGITVPIDFGPLLICAMEYLHKNGRSNIFYDLARGIGTMRDDGSDSRFPVKRMPFGLIDYMARFFSSESFQQVSKHMITSAHPLY